MRRDFKLLFYDPWFKLLDTPTKRDYHVDRLTEDYSQLKYYIEQMYRAKVFQALGKEFAELDEKIRRVELFNQAFSEEDAILMKPNYLQALHKLEEFFRENKTPEGTLKSWRGIIRDSFQEEY